MSRFVGIIVLSCLVVLSPSAGSTAALELSGTVGIPAEFPTNDHNYSLGRRASFIVGSAGPFDLGLRVGHNQFDSTNDESKVAFTTLAIDIRIPFVRAQRLVMFGVIAPELAIRTFKFSESAQAKNSLIPPGQSDLNFGLALGTGLSFDLVGEWLSLVTTQAVHFVSAEVEGNVLFVISFGVALSN